MVRGHPLGHDRAAAADDAGDALGYHGDVLDQYSGVNSKVVNTLLGLLLDDLEVEVDVEVLDALDAGERFVERDGADGHGGVAEDAVADFGDCALRWIGPLQYRRRVGRPCGACGAPSSMSEETAELPMLALTLQRVSMPMAMGSTSGWLILAGMIMRPAAISERMSSEEMFSRRATNSISSVTRPRRAEMHLADIGVAGALGLLATRGNPFGAGLKDFGGGLGRLHSGLVGHHFPLDSLRGKHRRRFPL